MGRSISLRITPSCLFCCIEINMHNCMRGDQWGDVRGDNSGATFSISWAYVSLTKLGSCYLFPSLCSNTCVSFRGWVQLKREGTNVGSVREDLEQNVRSSLIFKPAGACMFHFPPKTLKSNMENINSPQPTQPAPVHSMQRQKSRSPRNPLTRQAGASVCAISVPFCT